MNDLMRATYIHIYTYIYNTIIYNHDLMRPHYITYSHDHQHYIMVISMRQASRDPGAGAQRSTAEAQGGAADAWRWDSSLWKPWIYPLKMVNLCEFPG